MTIPSDDVGAPVATSGRSATVAGDASAADILEAMSDAFIALDREWRYTYVNRAAERLAGRRREDMLGRTRFDMCPPIVATQFESACLRAMDEGVSVYFEEGNAPLDRWFGHTACPSADGITVQARDITERKRAEAVVHRVMDDVQRRILEPTRGLGDAHLDVEVSVDSITENGTFGQCVVDGGPIEEKRLEGVPWTPYCLRHQQEIETSARVRTPSL